jgi:hypothetical protein
LLNRWWCSLEAVYYSFLCHALYLCSSVPLEADTICWAATFEAWAFTWLRYIVVTRRAWEVENFSGKCVALFWTLFYSDSDRVHCDTVTENIDYIVICWLLTVSVRGHWPERKWFVYFILPSENISDTLLWFVEYSEACWPDDGNFCSVFILRYGICIHLDLPYSGISIWRSCCYDEHWWMVFGLRWFFHGIRFDDSILSRSGCWSSFTVCSVGGLRTVTTIPADFVGGIWWWFTFTVICILLSVGTVTFAITTTPLTVRGISIHVSITTRFLVVLSTFGSCWCIPLRVLSFSRYILFW